MNDLSSELSNMAVGLSSFIDAPCGLFGEAADFGYELNLPLTHELEQLAQTLDSLSIGGGLDGPESQLEAMYQALTGEGNTVVEGDLACRGRADILPSDMGWRSDALGYLFVSTDASFHGPNDAGYPYARTADSVIEAANRQGTTIYFLQAGGSADAEASRIASATGGAVFTLSNDSREIADTVTNAVFGALSNTVVEVTTESDSLGFVTDITPQRLSGIDLLTTRTLDVSVTLLNTVRASGEAQQHDIDLVFNVNGREIARRPVSITVPAEDPKDCSNRPPIVRRLNTPTQMAVGTSGAIGVEIEDPDGDPVSVRWSASSGVINEPTGRSTRFSATTVGLVDLTVEIADAAGERDSATATTLVTGDACGDRFSELDLGVTQGDMLLQGRLDQALAVGSCGGSGAEGMVIVRVHRAGRYRFEMEPGSGWVLHLKERDCSTELACVWGERIEADLSMGQYLLFVDTQSAQVGAFSLSAGPTD